VDKPEVPRTEPGSTVTLLPRRGSEPWLAQQRVVELARRLPDDFLEELDDPPPQEREGL
jgi:hypothetical protein